MFHGMLLALGHEARSLAPPDRQLDWEALLTASPQQFADLVKPYVI